MLPDAAETFAVFEETDKVASPAAWVTVTIFEDTPVAETVTVAERVVNVVLAKAVKVRVILPFADAGLTVSHTWFDEAVHVVLEVTATDAILPAVLETLAIFADTDNDASPAAWVTVTVLEDTPVAETVTVAERVVIVGLAATVKVIVPFSLAETGLTVNHV